MVPLKELVDFDVDKLNKSSVGNGGTRTFLDFTHLSVVSVKI